MQQQLGLFAQPLDVDAVGERAGPFEGELRFLVAIGAGGTQNQRPRRGHAVDLASISGSAGGPATIGLDSTAQ